MWIKLAGFILRNRLALLIVLGVATIFMGYQASKVQMSYTQHALLPETDSVSIEYQHFTETFGKEGNVIFFAVDDSLFFEKARLNDWMTLSDSLQNIDGVDAVASITNAYSFEKDLTARKFDIQPIFPKQIGNESIDSLVAKVHQLEFYNKRLYNKETNSYLMLLTVNHDVIDSKERIPFMNHIKELILAYGDKYDLDIKLSGLPYIRIETSQMIKEEMFLFLILSLLTTTFILFLFFRSFRVTLFSILVVLIGVIWSVGIMGLLGYQITLLTAMLPPLLVVIGIPNSVFLVNKYHAEFLKHGNRARGLQRIIARVGNAIFLTNLTTASGFATFIITSSQILVEFGIVASLSILLLFVFSIIIVPSVLSFQSAPKHKHTKHLQYTLVNKLLNFLIHLVESKRNWVYAVTLSVLLTSALGISFIQSTGYVVDDLPQESKIMQDLRYFEANYGGLMPFEVLVKTEKPRQFRQVKALKDLEKLSDTIASYPEFSSPLSLVEIAKFATQSYYNGNEAYYKLPDRSTFNHVMSFASKSQENNENLLDAYMDSTETQTRLTFFMKDVGTTKMQELEKGLFAQLDTLLSDQYQITITGSSVVFFKGTKYLIRNLFLSLALAILLIATFMAIVFSSKRMVLIALIPNLIPLVVTAALMGYFDIPIKASTVLVFSIAFGISVDDTIHFLAKYRQELLLTNWNIKKSVLLALRETGQSMFYTSVILFFGFGIFTFSGFGGTQALGILVSLTLLTAMLSNLVLLPSLLMSLEKAVTNKAFKEPIIDLLDEQSEIAEVESEI